MMAAGHIERRHRIVLDGPVDRVFPLFTPAGEKAWAEGWDPEFLHPADGETREGMVFRTRHGGEITLWSCVDWQPIAHRVRYARVTPASRFGFVEVTCRALADGRTEANVTYTYTALEPEGRAHLEALSEAAFTRMIDGWRPAIDRCLHGSGPA